MMARRCIVATILFVLVFVLVDLAVSLPITYYTEAEDYSYRTKPCTSNPTPNTVQQAVSSASSGDVICLQPGIIYPEIIINSPQGSNNDYITIRNANLNCTVLKISNNYFDNSDTFFITDSTPSLRSDFELRFNYFQKKGDVDNIIGLSFTAGTSRVWIDSNYIAASNPEEGIISIAIGTRSMDDLTVTNNYFDTCLQALVLEDFTPNTPTSSIVFYGNFFANVTNTPFYLLAGMASYNISENTIIGDSDILVTFMSLYIVNATDVSMIVERNIGSAGIYGIVVTIADGIYNLLPADKLTWSDNLIASSFPYYRPSFPSVGTIFEDSFDNISFVNPSRRDYQLLSTSPYAKSNYGKQLGVDLCSLVRSAKLKFVLTDCSLTDVVIQPTEILVITDILTVYGNLTMFPDSVLKVDGVNALNITSCAQFDGTLDLTNVNQLINKTIVVAYYSCWSGGEFKDISYNDQTSDECNKLQVELSYQPTLVTATIVLVDQCPKGQTPSGQAIGPTTVGSNDPSSQDNQGVLPPASLPDWFLPVVIVGGAVFLTLVFIVLAVSVPSLKQRVFHKKRRFPSSMELSQKE